MSAATIRVMVLDFPCLFCSALWSFSENSGISIGEFAPVVFGIAIATPGQELIPYTAQMDARLNQLLDGVEVE